jgi:ribosomal protein L24
VRTEDFEEFLKMLEERKIHFERPYPAGVKYAAISAEEIIFGGIVVELTKEAVKAIIDWIKKRRKKGLKNPQLEFTVTGNPLKLSIKNMMILERMLEQASRNKKTRRKRRKKHEDTSQNEV